MTKFYDKLYQEFGREGSVFGRPQQKLVDFLNGYSFSGRRSCDLACGDGRDTLYLASNVWHVFAIDNSQEALQRLRKSMKKLGVSENIDLLCADVGQIRLGGLFDLIICGWAFHEIGEQWVRNIINQSKNVTKEGGVNYLSFFMPQPGTYMKKGCYYPEAQQILGQYEGWEILDISKAELAHTHLTLDSDGREDTHKHLVCDVFLKKPNSSAP